MGTFRLPSQDHAELLNMAEFQFMRSTPHQRSDMVVDVKFLEMASPTQSLVAGAMAMKDLLKPYADILKEAGLTPEVMTVNTQRLLPLARVVWGDALNGDGRVLGLCIDNGLWLGFFARGDMLFSREERQNNDMDSALGGFIEYCHKEFPGTPVREGMLLGDRKDTGMARMAAGVRISVQELSSMVRTPGEQAAFELSAIAYLDLLLAQDDRAVPFDFSPGEIKAERNRVKTNRLTRHVIVLAVMVLSGFLLLGLGRLQKEMSGINALRRAIERESANVKALEAKAGITANVRKHVSEKIAVSSLLADISRLLPKGARLNQAEFREGVLNLQGEAEDLAALQDFQKSLAGTSWFHDVRLEGIDKRPTETAQKVMFRMTMRVQK
jgi:Tfp pilus assembly protein PilN